MILTTMIWAQKQRRSPKLNNNHSLYHYHVSPSLPAALTITIHIHNYREEFHEPPNTITTPSGLPPHEDVEEVIVSIANGNFRWRDPIMGEKDKGTDATSTPSSSSITPSSKVTLVPEISTGTHSPVTKGSLSNLNLRLKRGELIMVVGAVGSGKTSLVLGALMGHMRRDDEAEVVYRTRVCMDGDRQTASVAYVAQSPWVFNGTVRAYTYIYTCTHRDTHNQIAPSLAMVSNANPCVHAHHHPHLPPSLSPPPILTFVHP